MIRFPRFERLGVEGYGMFPGTPENPGLRATFQPGLTLVLGANGLGKTTLVTLLYRMCTGPYDIAGLVGAAPLGTRSLVASRMQRWDQRVLAARVHDDAAQASATLEMSLGPHRIEITRSLRNLVVTRLLVDGEEMQATDERFQSLVTELCDVPSFGEWILLLRYLTFYTEDRGALVWDPSAQRQILRLLLLPRSKAAAWAEQERDVLELDSRVRNLQATLNREETSERRARTKAKDSKAILEELEALDNELGTQTAALNEISQYLPDAEQARQDARLRALTAEQDRDSTYRRLERLQLSLIAEAFPSHDATARYLIARLLVDGVCLTCGSEVPQVASELAGRAESSRCVVCASQVTKRKRPRRLQAAIKQAADELVKLDATLRAADHTRSEAEAFFEQVLYDFKQRDATIARLRARIAALTRRLPPNERSLRAQAAEVTSLRGRLETLKSHLEALRSKFEDLVRRDMRTIARQREQVTEQFEAFAAGFLLEDCDLRWSPHRARVGQTGPSVDFPGFELDMSGSDFPSPVRRSEPEQVSESQREFIDLAFRMALMAVAGESGAGTIVMDAPETSLDAVFSERAATVLLRFADPSRDNRLLITSNLTDGQLIPQMLKAAGITSPTDPRTIDLLRIATPTAATRQFSEEYARIRDGLFSPDGDGSRPT